MSIDPTAFVHPEAVVCGNVTLGPQSSVWPTAVLRGDTAEIVIGARSNVQDGTIIHVDEGVPVHVGDDVTIGHRVIVHGSRIGDRCLIGMGAILLNNVKVGEGSLIAAGAVCLEGMEIPPGSVVLGVPARVARAANEEIRSRIMRGARSYVELQERHRRGDFPLLGR